MKKHIVPLLSFYFLSFAVQAQTALPVNLFSLAEGGKLKAVRRTVQPLKDGPRKGIRLSENSGEGLVWIPAVLFDTGTISFDVRGKDEFQKSFVGLAFHGQNDSTYEAIYFRPFNFHATDSVRRIHAVQYVSHPAYPWKKLREEKNATFEKAVAAPPAATGWFRARVLIQKDSVHVYIQQRTTPELSVKRLDSHMTGRIGIFTGDGSGGDFANLAVTGLKPKK